MTTIQEAEVILQGSPTLIAKVQHLANTPDQCALTWETISTPVYAGCIRNQGALVQDVVLNARYFEGVSMPEGLAVLGMPTSAEVCRTYYGDQVITFVYITPNVVLSIDYPANPRNPQPESYHGPAVINAIDYHSPFDSDFRKDLKPPVQWQGFTEIPLTYAIGDCFITPP